MVQQLAKLGAILLLFMIGFECYIKEIFTKRSTVIALGGVVVPWVCGFALAELMLPEPGNGYAKLSQSVFVGAALTATSVAITVGVLRELRLIGSSTAKIIIGAAVVDDVIGMIVFAISKGTATGAGIDLGRVGHDLKCPAFPSDAGIDEDGKVHRRVQVLESPVVGNALVGCNVLDATCLA